MKKYILKIAIMMMVVATAFVFGACADDSDTGAVEEPTHETAEGTEADAGIDGTKLGYKGDDAAIVAVYDYLANEVSKDYDDADCTIPTVDVVSEDDSNPDDIIIKGCFDIYNYDIEGDTLKCVSGGSHPGCMHVKKIDEETCKVTSFEAVQDGGNFEPTAKKIFGDDYDKFMKMNGDQERRDKLRTETVETYVVANELSVTQYQDYGWDPVEIPF